MNLNTIVGTETAQYIAKFLASRERISHETNVDRFKTVLVTKGYKIVPEDFDRFFKDLEKEGFGTLIYGRGKSPTRFKWHYSLRDIGKAAINPGEEFQPEKLEENVVAIKRGKGRPKGAKNKVKRVLRTEEKVAVNESSVVFMYTTISGELVPLRLDEAERLMKQMEAVKARLA